MGKVDKTKITIREISKKIAKDMIVKNHYSHAWTSCRYALGIFYEMDNEHSFFDEKDEKLAGVAVYGYPVGAKAASSISPMLQAKEALELTRLFIYEEYGKNMESISISKTFKWLKQNAPDIKVLISYADPGQEHIGGIYQATNWVYQGTNLGIMDNYGIKLEPGGKWIHSRTVFVMFGSGNLEHLKSRIGHTFWRRKEPRKHRFFYLLGTKGEKKKIMSNLKHLQKPYPKNPKEYVPEIEEIIVEEKKDFYE
ncbi:hypothetical protein CL614_10560 [archaeon]|jgi:hypothetical protein|nr:hypothetical protein [archaeon]